MSKEKEKPKYTLRCEDCGEPLLRPMFKNICEQCRKDRYEN